MAHYVVSINGWETYTPYWFETDISESKFIEILQDCMREAVAILDKKDKSYRTGSSLMGKVIPLMAMNGLKLLRPDVELDVGGESYYKEPNNYEKRPEVIPDDVWKKLVRHNEDVHLKMYKIFEEKDRKKEAKKKVRNEKE